MRKLTLSISIVSFCIGSVLHAEEEGIMHFLSGKVRVNGEKATVGMVIHKGVTVETGPESVAEIRYGHETSLRIREKSSVKIDRTAKAYRILLAHGTILNLVKRNSEFEVRTPNTIAGARGTIFFVHVLDDTSAYICTCNGTVDLRDGERVLKTVSASHHRPYRIYGKPGQIAMEDQGMMMHTDVEIFEMRYRMEQEPVKE